MLEGLLQLEGVGLLPLLLLGVFVLVGLGFVAYGVSHFRTYLTLKSTTPTACGSVGSGFVEVEGEALVADRTLEAPFSGAQCLAYEFEIERYRHDDDGSNWHTKASGERTVPFNVTDGTGTVGVRPSAEALSVDRDYRTVVGRDEQPPERVRAFMDDRANLDHDTAAFDVAGISFGGDKHRFTERRVDPGTTAYAAGHAEPTTAVGGAAPTLVDHTSGTLDRLVGDPFVVADAGEDEAEWRHFKAGVGMTLFGLVFAGVPLFILL